MLTPSSHYHITPDTILKWKNSWSLSNAIGLVWEAAGKQDEPEVTACHLPDVLPWDHLASQKEKKNEEHWTSRCFDSHALDLLLFFPKALVTNRNLCDLIKDL